MVRGAPCLVFHPPSTLYLIAHICYIRNSFTTSVEFSSCMAQPVYSCGWRPGLEAGMDVSRLCPDRFCTGDPMNQLVFRWKRLNRVKWWHEFWQIALKREITVIEWLGSCSRFGGVFWRFWACLQWKGAESVKSVVYTSSAHLRHLLVLYYRTLPDGTSGVLWYLGFFSMSYSWVWWFWLTIAWISLFLLTYFTSCIGFASSTKKLLICAICYTDSTKR